MASSVGRIQSVGSWQGSQGAPGRTARSASRLTRKGKQLVACLAHNCRFERDALHPVLRAFARAPQPERWAATKLAGCEIRAHIVVRRTRHVIFDILCVKPVISAGDIA